MEITLKPIGIVHSERKDLVDDNWNNVNSWIELNDEIPAESISGLDSFSHIEVFFYFHKVDKSTIITAAGPPRGNENWPKVGIFSQRRKARPNLIGATIVKLLKVDGNKIFVKSLDAIDGTPIIDIKPVFKQYLPIDDVYQPEWVDELMGEY